MGWGGGAARLLSLLGKEPGMGHVAQALDKPLYFSFLQEIKKAQGTGLS